MADISTDEIFVGEDFEKILTDELERLDDEKAEVNHTHSLTSLGAAAATHYHDYAAAGHAHNIDEINDLEDALAGKAASTHTHTPASIGAATTTHIHNEYASSNHTHNEFAGASHVHTIAEVTGLETALDGKAASGHTHTPASIGAAPASHTHDYAESDHTHTAAALLAMAGALFGTNDIGGVEYSYGSGATSNLLTTMAAWPQGLHTAYVIAGTTGAPPVSGESWRIIAHKTSETIGWILAFGSSGSIFSNYQNSATTFRGWRAIYEAAPAPLWTGGANGGYYMTEGHTVTPSKKLSECRNGWILLWSDFDVGDQANNTDFCTTIIPKRAYTGQVWNGAMWYCDVPTYAAGTATDSEVRVIKVLQVYDAKLVGTANNAAAPRNDVVLRAVYEF